MSTTFGYGGCLQGRIASAVEGDWVPTGFRRRLRGSQAPTDCQVVTSDDYPKMIQSYRAIVGNWGDAVDPSQFADGRGSFALRQWWIQSGLEPHWWRDSSKGWMMNWAKLGRLTYYYQLNDLVHPGDLHVLLRHWMMQYDLHICRTDGSAFASRYSALSDHYGMIVRN